MTGTMTIWLQLTGILALEISLLAALGALLHRLVRSAAWQRTIWQACLVATITTLIMELGGIARAFLPGPVKGILEKAHPAQGHPIPSQETPETALEPGGTQVADPAEAVRQTRSAQGFRSRVMAKASTAEAVLNPPARHNMSAGTVPQLPISTASRERLALATPGHSAGADWQLTLAFGLVWMFGIGLVFGRSVLGRVLFILFRRKWRRVADAELQERVQALARSLGLRRKVRLIESESFGCPMAFGVFRPTIGLPSGFASGFERPQREAILLHELAHLWAGDPAWGLISDLATALVWWHPLVWWMRRRLLAANETAADEASLLLANGPDVLAECLVKLGAQLAGRQPARHLGIAVTGFRSGLGRRVERLVHLKGQAWSPPCPRRSAAARSAGTFALVLTAILCTAWAVPAGLTKGENMQTMQYTWKRSLAAFALLATLGTENHAAMAQEQAEGASTPPNPPAADVVTSHAASATPTVAFAAPASSGDTSTAAPLTYQWPFAGQDSGPETRAASKEKQAVEAKLKQIKLDSVAYDGVTLGDVVRHLGETAAGLDPDKVGINFLVRLETQPPPAVTPGAIDPTTGLPLASAPAEAIDLNSVAVRIEPPLKQVRLCDVLDAITKVADHPIKYTIEDYGVVFSLDQPKLPGPPARLAAPEPLSVRTFKVDTNTFSEGLEAAFGIRLAAFGGTSGPKNIQEALRDLLVKLGINTDAQNKSIFYNKLTGILMVRGTTEDLAVVQAAIETLGGREYSAANAASAVRDIDPATGLPVAR